MATPAQVAWNVAVAVVVTGESNHARLLIENW
jgi:hypothetical protein